MLGDCIIPRVCMSALRHVDRGRVRLRMQMHVFPGMCEFMHAVAAAGRSYVQENRDTGHLAWRDCNRRCICTYVRRGLYRG